MTHPSPYTLPQSQIREWLKHLNGNGWGACLRIHDSLAVMEQNLRGNTPLRHTCSIFLDQIVSGGFPACY